MYIKIVFCATVIIADLLYSLEFSVAVKDVQMCVNKMDMHNVSYSRSISCSWLLQVYVFIFVQIGQEYFLLQVLSFNCTAMSDERMRVLQQDLNRGFIFRLHIGFVLSYIF